MSTVVKGTLIDAALGAILITLLLLPVQAAFPQMAPYTPFAILPIPLFFALRMPLGGLLAMFLSFLAGTVWGLAFTLVAGPMIGANPASTPVVLAVGVTGVIFGILAVHPLLLGRTPLAVVPAVLLGFLEMLMVLLIMNNPGIVLPGAPKLDWPWVVGIFAYGCLMTAIMLVVSGAVTDKVVGRNWRPVETGAQPQAEPAHR